MKKFNLLMAAGLMSFASMQAQTTIASLGFEPSDTKYTTAGALTPGGTFGDWVNVKEGDVTRSLANTLSAQRTLKKQVTLGTVVSRLVTFRLRRTLLTA